MDPVVIGLVALLVGTLVFGERAMRRRSAAKAWWKAAAALGMKSRERRTTGGGFSGRIGAFSIAVDPAPGALGRIVGLDVDVRIEGVRPIPDVVIVSATRASPPAMPRRLVTSD